MFEPNVYRVRREALIRLLPGALILLPSASAMPIDFPANTYPFVQDGSFRYFFGVDRPDLVGLIDADSGTCALYGADGDLDEAIWLGARASLAAAATAAAIDRTAPLDELRLKLETAARQSRPVLYTPPYSAQTTLLLATLLGRRFGEVPAGISAPLIDAIVSLREVKAPEEIAEIERVLAVTAQMHHTAMNCIHPGMQESQVAGRAEEVVRSAGMRLAYQPILTARGEILHNLRTDGVLQNGDLIVHDAGARGSGGYTSDITRTIPASGRFDPLQRQLYEIVLRAQENAIAGCVPGRRFLDLHLDAARSMVADLVDVGLLAGDVDEIVVSGAYAICFPTGLGHLFGLDVHDMESLGEDRVGYGSNLERSPHFGLRSLRLAKPLRDGMTVTVEPGLYFIPPLIDAWKAQRRFDGLIDYAAFEKMKSFGGIRIEDDVLVTPSGGRIIGPQIAKAVDDIEERMRSVTEY